MKYLIILILFSFLKQPTCVNSNVLIARPKSIVRCGGIMFAAQFLFYNTKDYSTMIGIVLCPDGYGEDFFKVNSTYCVEFSKDSILPKGYRFMNELETEKYTPKRVVKNIKPGE